MDKTKKLDRLQKLLKFKQDKDFTIFKSIIESADKIDEAISAVEQLTEETKKKDLDFEEVLTYLSERIEEVKLVADAKQEKGDKGDKGDKGEQGPQGEKGEKGDKGDRGLDGITPIKGVDYFTPEEVTSIKTEVEATLVSLIPKPDTTDPLERSNFAQVARKLETLTDDDRLDFKALKNAPDVEKLKELILNNKVIAGGGGMLEVFSGANKVNSSHRMNITGGGVVVTNDGGVTKVDLSNVGTTDHSALTNLEWSKAGHTIDTTVDFLNNDIDNLEAIQWNLTPSQTATEGLMYWNSDDGTLNLGMPGGNVNLQLGQETILRCRNNSGVDISNGEVVYVTGSQANRPTIAKAQGNSEATSYVFGVATEDIANNSWGFVTSSGYVRDFDTRGGAENWQEGDVLYNSTTVAGGLTNVEPSAPHHSDKIGQVITVDQNNGVILVRIRHHRAFTELSDVNGTPLDTTGQLAVWDNDNSYFDFNYNITNYYHKDNDSASDVKLATVDGATYNTVQEMQDIYHSTGLADGGVISDNGDGTYAVAAGSGYIRATNDQTDTLLAFDFSANASLTPNTGRNYVGVEYNAGSPQIVQRASYNWNYQTDFPLGEVVKEDSTLHIFNASQKVGDHAGKMIEAMEETMVFARNSRDGGLILGESGTRNVTLTAGEIWYGLNKFSISALDTSVSGSFEAYYRDSPSGYVLVTGLTQWNNNQYDNGSGTLQSMTVARYANNWFYADLEDNLIMLYPRNQYTTLAQALDAPPPSQVPDRVASHCKLIGRIVFQTNAGTATEIQSVFDTSFSSTGVTSHNDLGGLQGGTVGEYYHLTATEYSNLGDISAVGDVTSGAAFDGTQGTTLTFYNAGGNATQAYDGTDIAFDTGLEVTVPNLYGQPAGIFTRTSGEFVYLCDSSEAVYAVAPSGSKYTQLASDSWAAYFSDSTDYVEILDGAYALYVDVSSSGTTYGAYFTDQLGNVVTITDQTQALQATVNGDFVNLLDGSFGIQVSATSGITGATIYDTTYSVFIADAANNFVSGASGLTVYDGGNYTQLITSTSAIYIDTTSGGITPITIVEQADPLYTASAGIGRIWVKNATPNELYFTDDAGTDWLLNQTTGGAVNTVGDSSAQAAVFDGSAGGGTTLTFYNVGGNATLAYDGTDFDFSKPVTITDGVDTVYTLDGSGIDVDTSGSGDTSGYLTDGVNYLYLADNSASSGQVCSAYLTDGASITYINGTMTGASETSNIFNITGTLPSTITATASGALFDFTTAGTSAYDIRGLRIRLNAGYTGGGQSAPLRTENNVAGTGGILTASGILANMGMSANALATTATGYNAGTHGYAQGGKVNIGMIGFAPMIKTSAANIGVFGFAYNGTQRQIGGYFRLGNPDFNYTNEMTLDACIVANNTNTSESLFSGLVNNVETIRIGGTGNVLLLSDSTNLYLGASADVRLGYDGTNTNLVNDVGTGRFNIQMTAYVSGNIELGHTSDTTLARSSAGNVTIEGNIIYRAGGTDVPVTDGGTGASTAQAAIDTLTQVSGATNEHVLTKDTATGNAIFKAIPAVEGTAVKSTGEAGGTKFLREDGDGTCSWQTVSVGQSGWFGSTTRIKILPADFIGTAQDKSNWLTTTGTYTTDENATCVAQVAIPTGYKATVVMVYSNQNNGVTVYENEISDGTTATSKGTGNCNTEIDITDVTSSTTNYLSIVVASTSDQTWGGYVTIEAV